jgi:hypothetical protein
MKRPPTQMNVSSPLKELGKRPLKGDTGTTRCRMASSCLCLCPANGPERTGWKPVPPFMHIIQSFFNGLLGSGPASGAGLM